MKICIACSWILVSSYSNLLGFIYLNRMRQWRWMVEWLWWGVSDAATALFLSLLFYCHCKFLSEALKSFLLSSPMIIPTASCLPPPPPTAPSTKTTKARLLFLSAIIIIIINNSTFFFSFSSSFGYNEAVMMFHATASDQTLWVKKKTAVSWRGDSNLQPCLCSSSSLCSLTVHLYLSLLFLFETPHTLTRSYAIPLFYTSCYFLSLLGFFFNFFYLFFESLALTISPTLHLPFLFALFNQFNFMLFIDVILFSVLFLSQEWEADID